MLTPQEITDKVFVKAVFGGYDMTGVDDFLEAVCADYTSLYKENAILKGKLKVLVEKVEEYRSTEDAMRMALLTAQRMGDEITSEANKLKEETLRNTELETQAKLEESARRIADEEFRLSIAAKETAKFIELSKAIMHRHSDFLAKLETARRTVQPEAASAQQNSRGDQTGGVSGGPIRGSKAAPESAVNHAQYYDDGGEQTRLYAIKDPEDDDSVTPRPKFDFDDLKFGSNFDNN